MKFLGVLVEFVDDLFIFCGEGLCVFLVNGRVASAEQFGVVHEFAECLV